MSLLGDLKKVLFGAKSVTKSAADKAAEAAKETGAELREKGEEWGRDAREKVSEVTDKAGDALGNLTDSIWEEAEYAAQRGKELKDKAEDWLNDKIGDNDTPAYAEEDLVPPTVADALTDEPVQRATPLDFEAELDPQAPPRKPSELSKKANKMLDKAAYAGNDALDAASKAGKKIMDVSEDIGGKILEKGGDVFDRLKEAGKGLEDKAGDLVDRAQAEAAKENMEDAIAKAERLQREAKERADNALSDTKESLLEGKDDFFAKADRFARGDYHNTGKMDEGHMEIREDPDYVPRKLEGNIAGFEDLDGDGDSLIDDAIIDEEE